MMSFELFRLLKFIRIYILKYIMGDKLHHFMKKHSDILHQIMVY